MKLLQIDFPFAGPWARGLAETLADLARDIAVEPGLVWKIWTENPATGEAGGIYLFESEPALDHYLAKHLARLAAFGVDGIRARKFDVNYALSEITAAPVAAATATA